MKTSYSGLVLAVAGLGAALFMVLPGCGSTKRSPTDEAPSGGGAAGEPGASAGTSASPSAGASSVAGSATIGGMSAVGGAGGSSPEAGNGGEGGAPELCIEGAACTCGDLTGVLTCAGSTAGECSCPPAAECQGSVESCFEPCGGDALGLWVLEETCLRSALGGACEGGSLEATSFDGELRLRILEGENVELSGSESVDVLARVPLSCLGIESVNRCVDADYYSSPLFFTGSADPLDCEPSDCGVCECSGNVWGGRGSGDPWKPGDETLSFGAIAVPYCVEGDTLWAGGANVGGQPKVAYKFRKRSCVGTPLPCEQRDADECVGSGDCQTGRCVASAGGDVDCADLSYKEACEGFLGCDWEPGGCWGDASDRCDPDYCEATPGCSWGAPAPRCGGESAYCYDLDPADCNVPGCSMRTCDVPDGWGGIDGAPCAGLTTNACLKAPGCSVSGGACTGTTLCGAQTDPTVCAALECAVYEKATCGGRTTRPCSELSIADCRTQPGCRVEW